MTKPPRVKILDMECYKVPDFAKGFMQGCAGCLFNGKKNRDKYCMSAGNNAIRGPSTCSEEKIIYIAATPEALKAYTLRRVAQRLKA